MKEEVAKGGVHSMKDVFEEKEGPKKKQDPKKKKTEPKHPKKKKTEPKQGKWDIVVDKSKEFYTANRKVLNRNYGKVYVIEEVCNVQKEVGKEAVFLLRYNSGQRDWCAIEPCLKECGTKVNFFMKDNGLTWEKLGYSGPFPEDTKADEEEAVNNTSKADEEAVTSTKADEEAVTKEAVTTTKADEEEAVTNTIKADKEAVTKEAVTTTKADKEEAVTNTSKADETNTEADEEAVATPKADKEAVANTKADEETVTNTKADKETKEK